MSLYYASKYALRPGTRPRRVESIGFSSLITALAVVREMSEAARPGEAVWIVTTQVDGVHAPACIGRSSNAALLIAGAYDIERAEELESHAA